MTFDPHAPLVVGNEWRAVRQSAVVLGANGNVWADKFTSSASEAIDRCDLYLPTVATPGYYVCEIFQANAWQSGAVTTYVYRPNADYGNVSPFAVGFWENQAGSSTPGVLYQSIDESTLDPADYLVATNACYGALYAFNAATGAHPLGERVMQVRIQAIMSCDGGNQLGMGLWSASPPTWTPFGVTYTGRQQVTVTLPYLHPFTNLPWTGQDVRDLASGVGVAFQHTGSFALVGGLQSQPSHIEQAWVEVDTVVENREALTARFVSASGWVPFTLAEPDGTDNWPKAAATDYLVTLRRTTTPNGLVGNVPGPQDVGQVGWRYLSGEVPCPQADHSGAEWAVNNNSTTLDATYVEHPLVGLTDVMVRDDAAISADSQPYALLLAAECDATYSPRQQFSDHDTDDYGRLVARVARLAGTTDDLTATVRKQSDDSALGPAAVLTVAEFDALAEIPGTGGSKRWDVVFGPASLTSGQQCYVEFTCPGTSGWTVAYADTVGTGDTATYGGVTDRAKIAGSLDSDADLDATLAILPDPVTGCSVMIGSVMIPADGGRPDLTEIEYAVVTWDATSLGGTFGRYVVERSIDGGDWETVAYPTPEMDGYSSTKEFDDYETPRGVEACYRVSVERDDGTRSVPCDAGCVTCLAPGCAFLFVTNEDPTLNLAYRNVGNRKWSFLDAGNVKFQSLYRRNYQVAFGPLEKAGDQFSLDLLVAFDARTPGRSAFDDLIALCTDTALSYVCVLDEAGGRWLAEVQVSEGRRDEPQGQYEATIAVTETTATSSTP